MRPRALVRDPWFILPRVAALPDSGIAVATIVNWIFVRYRWDKNVPWGIVVYPCLAAFFTFTMWLIFFA
jgi:hypothetical protein